MDAERLRKDEGSGAAVEPLEWQWHEPLYRYAELLSGCISARLTGTRGTEELYDLHVRDCLESVPLLPASGSVVDVGSGGGLPGVVWAHDIWRKNNMSIVNSLLKPDCLDKGHLINELGYRYNATFNMESAGNITFINSMSALKKLVYDDKNTKHGQYRTEFMSQESLN